jgi:tetratricopeptide (TPR) repeat protein
MTLIAVTGVATVRHVRRNSYDALMAEATQHYEEERHQPALDAYRQASERYPGRIEPILGMAGSAERIGEVELAIDAYRAGLEILPDDAAPFRAVLLCERGRLYVLLKDWESAQRDFEAAASFDPTDFNAWFSLGAVFEKRDMPQDALTAYRRALDLSPSSDAAEEAMGRVSALIVPSEEDLSAMQEQKYAEAVQVGNIALKLKRYDEASKRFAEALIVRSDDVDAWLGFADAREGLGDLAGAISSCERILKKDPENPDAQERLLLLQEKAAEAAKKRPSRSRSGRSAPAQS